MSEFQLSLVLIGIVVIIGVFAYNKWQERRAIRTADETFKSRHPDVLIGGGSRASGDDPMPITGDTPRMEPSLAPRPSHTAARNDGRGSEVVLPHSRIDYIIEMSGDEPVGTAAFAELWSGIDHRFHGRASAAGWIDGRWAPLPPGGACSQLQAALQLVSRRGVVSEAELIEFRSGVETLAARLRVSAASPEMRDALDAARVLDIICAEADIQVAFHVVAAPGAAFAGTKLRAAAEASGFVMDAEGRFTLCDDDGRELYVLSDRSGLQFSPATMKDATPQALTLSMDVPRAPDTQRTFESMVRFAKHIANLLGGGVVDDNNQPLDERAVSAISTQLAVVRRNLEAQGIAPGSALALRLFS